MRIEHVAVYYNDIERAKEFFSRYFGAKAGKPYHNERTGFSSYFLSFEDGTRLEIMTRPDINDEEKKPFRSGYVHMAFSTGSKENVDCITSVFKSRRLPHSKRSENDRRRIL